MGSPGRTGIRRASATTMAGSRSGASREGAPPPRPFAGGAGSDGIVSGNAFADGARHHGWFIGHFLEGADLRRTDEVEVKLITYRGKDARPKPVLNRTASTLVILIVGRIRLCFPEQEIVLQREGDYTLWGPGVPHTWVAEAASRVITIRWPSRSADQVRVGRGDPAPEGSQPLREGLGAGSATQRRRIREDSRGRGGPG